MTAASSPPSRSALAFKLNSARSVKRRMIKVDLHPHMDVFTGTDAGTHAHIESNQGENNICMYKPHIVISCNSVLLGNNYALCSVYDIVFHSNWQSKDLFCPNSWSILIMFLGWFW